jgi:hypothetical protein
MRSPMILKTRGTPDFSLVVIPIPSWSFLGIGLLAQAFHKYATRVHFIPLPHLWLWMYDHEESRYVTSSRKSAKRGTFLTVGTESVCRNRGVKSED